MTDREVDETFAPWCRSLTAESPAGVGWRSGFRSHGLYLAARHPRQCRYSRLLDFADVKAIAATPHAALEGVQHVCGPSAVTPHGRLGSR